MKYDQHRSELKNLSVISYISICQADHYTSLRLSIRNHNDCHSIFVLRLPMIDTIYTYIKSCNSYHTVVNVGHNNAHRYGVNYFLHGCHKGMHDKYWLASCFYGICAQTTGWSSWHCMVNAFCIDDSVCGESTAHRWILSQTINRAELCCLITAFCIVGGALMISDFRIAGLVCSVSIGSKGFRFSFMFARTSSWSNGRFASQLKTPDAHMMSRVDRGLLCVICHSVIDDITSPAYGETGNRWIPAAMDAWNQHLDSRPKGCGETTVMWWNHRSPVNSRRMELSYGGPVCGDSITIDQQCRALNELFN